MNLIRTLFNSKEFSIKFPAYYDNRELLLSLIENVFDYLPDSENKIANQSLDQIHSFLWEIQLMHLLKYQGYELQRGGLEGPDIICKKDGKTFLIECMLVENWEKGGRGNAYYSSHEEDKILKYTGAIVEKGKQFEKWSEKKLIPANSIRIIAIGGALQSLSDIHTGIPDIVKSVYPIGNSYYSVPLDGPERYLVNHEPRNRIIKVSGAEIPTDLFLKEKFQNISGLIYNPYSILQRDVSEGKGYIVVSNHGAEESIPINLIIGSLFYYIDDKGNLRHKSVE